MERHREEVLNVYLAECLRDLGLAAAGEQIEVIASKRALPDVLIEYMGLRCVIESKYADSADAAKAVHSQARERLENGIAHIAIAVQYPIELREVSQATLRTALSKAQMQFCVCTITRYVEVEWKSGSVVDILDLLRRGYADLSEDDVVARSVAILESGMTGLLHLLDAFPDAAERVSDIIGLTEDTKTNETEGEDDA